MDEWSNGINEWCFTKKEIIEEFEKKKIKIPEPLLKDFDNRIQMKRIKRLENEIKRMKS